MATQSVEFTAPPNQTLTVRLFAAGSDTIVATAGTVTAATNRAGLYTAAFTDVPAGRYRLIATNAAGTPLATWWTDLTLTTATFPAYEMPLSAITEIQAGLALASELAKVPKSGETRRYTQVASNTGNKTADVSIGTPL